MENQDESNPDKLLNLSKLNMKDQRNALLTAFLSYPTSYGYKERIHDIAARCSRKPIRIFEHARRHNWEHSLEQVLDAQKSEEAFTQALDAAHPLHREIPLSLIVGKVKGLAVILLNATLRNAEMACLLIEFYALRITRVAADAGGFNLLSPEQLKEVKGYQQQLAHYSKQIEPYAKPGAVASLLNSINFSANIPQDAGEIDASAFTIHSLAAKMRELQLGSPAFDNPDRAVRDFTPPEGLPDLSGWANANPPRPGAQQPPELRQLPEQPTDQ